MEDNKIPENIYDFSDLNCEIIKLINRAYRKGFINGREAEREESKMNSVFYDEEIVSCNECVFWEGEECNGHISDTYGTCLYYSTHCAGCATCSAGVSKYEYPDYITDDLRELLNDFADFRCDGGCDRCNSMKCTSSPAMILTGNICNEFKNWKSEEFRGTFNEKEIDIIISALQYFKEDHGCDNCDLKNLFNKCTMDLQHIEHGDFCNKFKNWLKKD